MNFIVIILCRDLINMLLCLFYLINLFIYLFLERVKVRGRDKERDRWM